MQNYWANIAKHGTPNGVNSNKAKGGSVEWPEYKEGKKIVFEGGKVRVGKCEKEERMKLWKEFYPKGVEAKNVQDLEEEPFSSFLANSFLKPVLLTANYVFSEPLLLCFLLLGVSCLYLTPRKAKAKKDIKSKKE